MSTAQTPSIELIERNEHDTTFTTYVNGRAYLTVRRPRVLARGEERKSRLYDTQGAQIGDGYWSLDVAISAANRMTKTYAKSLEVPAPVVVGVDLGTDDRTVVVVVDASRECTIPEGIERTICERIVDDALSAGYSIAVWEGEDWALKASRDRAVILSSMASTDEDTLFLKDRDGRRVGSILLVYGNGNEVVADHTYNDRTEAVLSGAGHIADLDAAAHLAVVKKRELFPTGMVGWMTAEQYFRWSDLRLGWMLVRKADAVTDANWFIDPGFTCTDPARKLHRMNDAVRAGIIFG